MHPHSKKCSKCKQVKADTAYPIYIFLGYPVGLYNKCYECTPQRILKRMNQYFGKFRKF